MKPKSKMLLALSCFLAGFFTCLLMMRQVQLTPPASTQAEGILVLAERAAAVRLQPLQSDRVRDGNRFQHPDGPLRVEPGNFPGQGAPQLRTGYYDLIDTRIPSGFDLRESK